MTREEIIKIFEENHIAKGNATINATKLAEIFTKHETDLLKAFVEWLKDRFDKRIDEQTAKCERIENEGDDGTYLTSYMECVANNEGILTGFVNAKWWLEELDTIEKFLEERTNERNHIGL